MLKFMSYCLGLIVAVAPLYATCELMEVERDSVSPVSSQELSLDHAEEAEFTPMQTSEDELSSVKGNLMSESSDNEGNAVATSESITNLAQLLEAAFEEDISYEATHPLSFENVQPQPGEKKDLQLIAASDFFNKEFLPSIKQ